ncbi:MAG: hypothetical protein V4850_20910 [Myxococcota bacterium]
MRWTLPARVAMAIVLVGGMGAARAQEAEDPDDGVYSDEGSVEVGGSLAVSWTKDLFAVHLGPSVGWFVRDNVEVSVLTRLSHLRPAAAVATTSGSVVLEPSFHLPLSEARQVFLFGGLGVGVGYDGDHADLEVIPRVGMNLEIGRSGVLTPAARVPIQIGRHAGPADDEVGAEVGFAFEVGMTTAF